ncbi:MAG: hypothetical protein VKK43_09175 [Synechococcaceae cyanobacterium]|nr:hypothetical protein [Synechococcaceae cyanobacterium]
MTADRSSLFGFRLAPAASRTAPAAASALSAKVGGPEPTALRSDSDAPLAFRSAPLLSQADSQGA